MWMYPAYKLHDVMDEYAVTFFALLNEGYRLRYAAALLQAQIGDLPQMEKADRQKFYRNLEWAATHPGDILKPDSTGSSPAQIKKLLGG